MRNSILSSVIFVVASSAFALEARISITVSESSQPVISGTTNLPNDTDLMIEISRKKSNYSAQSIAKVVDGKFQAGPFSQYSSPLNPGNYEVQVLMPVAAVQSEAVKASIGSNGERLSGPLVKRFEFGGKIVEYKTTFNVGSGGTNSKADIDAKRQAEANKRVWLVQSCNDICAMSEESARRAGQRWSLRICSEACIAEVSRRGR